jgi:predicted molibdopterin-dependent oxidoreductase YjgC
LPREEFLRSTSSEPASPAAEPDGVFVVHVDGRPVTTYAGQTVAALLFANGIRVFGRSAQRDEPRGVFCGIGICYECLVTVNGAPNVRACVTVVARGMSVETRGGA